MPATTACVNQNLKNFVYFDQSHGLCLKNNSTLLKIPQNQFGAWYLATRRKNMHFDKQVEDWIQSINPYGVTLPDYIVTTPRDYQKLALYRMFLSDCALWLDMGLGKTFVAISFCLILYEKKISNIYLIVCPAGVFVTWMDEIIKHVSLKCNVIIAHGAKKKELLNKLRFEENNNPTFIVTNYESLNSIKEDLATLKIGAIFLDESHKIKNPKTINATSAFLIRNSFMNSRRFVMSGTPSTTKPNGFYNQLEWLNTGFSGAPNYDIFQRTYIKSKLFIKAELKTGKILHIPYDNEQEKEDWLSNNMPPEAIEVYKSYASKNLSAPEISYKSSGYYLTKKHADPNPKAIKIVHFYPRTLGVQNLDQLHNIMMTHSYRLEKEEVLDELPDKIITKRIVELTKEQKNAYLDIINNNKTTLETTTFSFKNRSSPHAKLHQIANGFILNQDKIPTFFKTQPKLDTLKEILEELGDKKLVVWSPYRAQIQQIVNFLNKEEISNVQLHGDTAIKDRPAVVHTFQDPHGARVLVGNPDVGGLGLNLTCAFTVVIMTNWYKPDVRDQAIDRLHRMGQKNTVTAIDIVAKATLEVKLLKDLNQKIDTENKVISIGDLSEGA
jgi:SNF2 family DNA or RNA helicase